MVSKKYNWSILLFFSFVFLKLFLELGYWRITSADYIIYNKEFDLIKYITGWLWCCIIFFSIPHSKKLCSTFFLYFKFCLEIIPITVIYGLGNQTSLFYNTLCFSFIICILIVRNISIHIIKKIIINVWRPFVLVISICIILLILYITAENGLPTLLALDFGKVYDLRSSDSFYINKYMSYILRFVIFVFLPVVLSRALCLKQYFRSILYILFVFFVYLYSGMKAYLFSIPLIVILTVWSKRKNFYYEFFCTFSTGVTGLVIFIKYHTVFRSIYSLFIRRVLFVSANNKFKYYDFFSQNPKVGMSGELPTWLVNIPNHYPEGIGYIISDVYYGMPEMNSNTGFMVEGYMRYGFIGMFIIFIIFAVILLMIDDLAKRSDYSFAIGACSFSIFLLSDGYLLTMVPWLAMMLILIFYSDLELRKKYKEKEWGT